jgi:hypothetical protein
MNGLDDEEVKEPSLLVMCTLSPTLCSIKRRKMQPQFPVSSSMMDVSKLLQTLTLCPDHKEEAIPLSLSAKQWKDASDFVDTSTRTRIYFHPRVFGYSPRIRTSTTHMMCLARLLPVFSYLQMDDSIMNIAGEMMMQWILKNVTLNDVQCQELVGNVRQHLPFRCLVSGVTMRYLTSTMETIDVRLLPLLNHICDTCLPITRPKFFDTRDNVFIMSPFLEMVENCFSTLCITEEVHLKKIYSGFMMASYCDAWMTGKSVENIKESWNETLIRAKMTSEERHQFWTETHEVAKRKKAVYDRRMKVQANRIQVRDELWDFLQSKGFHHVQGNQFANEDLVFGVECHVDVSEAVMPSLETEDMTDVQKITDQVMDREWKGFHLLGAECKFPIFRRLEDLRDFLTRKKFGLLDVLAMEEPLTSFYSTLKVPDQVIPANEELPWEIHIVTGEIKVKYHPGAELQLASPIVMKFKSVIEKLAVKE